MEEIGLDISKYEDVKTFFLLSLCYVFPVSMPPPSIPANNLFTEALGSTHLKTHLTAFASWPDFENEIQAKRLQKKTRIDAIVASRSIAWAPPATPGTPSYFETCTIRLEAFASAPIAAIDVAFVNHLQKLKPDASHDKLVFAPDKELVKRRIEVLSSLAFEVFEKACNQLLQLNGNLMNDNTLKDKEITQLKGEKAGLVRDLAKAQADLAQEKTSLAAEKGLLTTCQTDLTTARQDLANEITAHAATRATLSAAQAALAAAQAALAAARSGGAAPAPPGTVVTGPGGAPAPGGAPGPPGTVVAPAPGGAPAPGVAPAPGAGGGGVAPAPGAGGGAVAPGAGGGPAGIDAGTVAQLRRLIAELTTDRDQIVLANRQLRNNLRTMQQRAHDLREVALRQHAVYAKIQEYFGDNYVFGEPYEKFVDP
jgi:hypothetical protein